MIDNMKNNAIKEQIMKGDVVSSEIRRQFFPGWKFGQIRDWMEANGLDRHTCIELNSTEVAIITPKGILMQVRSSDNGILGMWGGVLNDGEEALDGAVREVKEETGIDIPKEDFIFREINDHTHEYSNGDKALFHTHRFVVTMDYVPEVKTDEESYGAQLVKPILKHQLDFILHLLYEEN